MYETENTNHHEVNSMVLPALLVNLRTHHAQAGDTTLSAAPLSALTFGVNPPFRLMKTAPALYLRSPRSLKYAQW